MPWFQLEELSDFKLGREPFSRTRRHAVINLSWLRRMVEDALAEVTEGT